GKELWSHQLRDDYGININSSWLTLFDEKEKISLMARAIGVGLLSPEAFATVFKKSNNIILFSDEERAEISKNLTLGFIHSSLDKHYGEKWINRITGEQVLVDDLYDKFVRLPQGSKLKFIDKELPPYKEENLLEYNSALKKYGFRINLPKRQKYQWEFLDYADVKNL
ncbi:MAG: hypothetical protein HON90_06905, partial [Halobacteriovoraceae bacterium]|nr:hypothetical protein [Halobacteriovoraceae bacterium]